MNEWLRSIDRRGNRAVYPLDSVKGSANHDKATSVAIGVLSGASTGEPSRVEVSTTTDLRAEVRELLRNSPKGLRGPGLLRIVREAVRLAPRSANNGDNRDILRRKCGKIIGDFDNEKLSDSDCSDLINQILSDFVDNTREIERRVRNDLDEIREAFFSERTCCLPLQICAITLSEVALTEGETHRLGHVTCFVTIRMNIFNQKQIVYKPRDLRIDDLIAGQDKSFFSLLNRYMQGDIFGTYRFIRGKDEAGHYGYVEKLSRDRASLRLTREEGRRVTYQLGALEAVCRILTCEDWHKENVIPRGRHLYPIDLEAIFHVPEVYLFNETQRASGLSGGMTEKHGERFLFQLSEREAEQVLFAGTRRRPNDDLGVANEDYLFVPGVFDKVFPHGEDYLSKYVNGQTVDLDRVAELARGIPKGILDAAVTEARQARINVDRIVSERKRQRHPWLRFSAFARDCNGEFMRGFQDTVQCVVRKKEGFIHFIQELPDDLTVRYVPIETREIEGFLRERDSERMQKLVVKRFEDKIKKSEGKMAWIVGGEEVLKRQVAIACQHNDIPSFELSIKGNLYCNGHLFMIVSHDLKEVMVERFKQYPIPNTGIGEEDFRIQVKHFARNLISYPRFEPLGF